MPYCYKRFCKNNCSKDETPPTVVTDTMNCFCDRVCILYGDCCPDYYSFCLEEANISLPLQPGNYEWVANQVDTMTSNGLKFKLMMILFKHKTCIKFKTKPRDQHIWVIGKCPEFYNISSIAQKCQNQTADVIGTIPATHKIYQFITFQNIYCAICQGVSRNELQVWDTSLRCLVHAGIHEENITFDTLLDYLNNGQCFYKLYFPQTIELRYCHISDVVDTVFANRNSEEFVLNLLQPTTVETTVAPTTFSPSKLELNKTNQFPNASVDRSEVVVRYLELCGAYRYLFSIRCYIHRNVHCRYIKPGLRVAPFEIFKCSTCRKFVLSPRYASLGILFSFSQYGVSICDSTTTCMGPKQKECLVDEVYDYYLNQCRQLVCPVGRLPINGSCVINGSLMGDQQLQMFPRGFQVIQVNITYNNDSCEMSNKLFVEDIYSTFQTSKIEPLKDDALKSVAKNRSGRKVTLVLISSCLQNGQTQIKHNIYNYGYSSYFLNALFKLLSDQHIGRNINEATLSTFPNNEDLGCANNTHARGGNGTLEENDRSWLVYHDPMYYPLENIPFIVKIGLDHESRTSLVEYTVCEMDSGLLDCPMISYPENLTENQNKTLHILGTDLYFSFGSFVFQENRVYVCSNFNRNYLSNEIVQFFKFNSTQGLLTLACSVISVFSLALTLIIYFTLPELRNIPGKIVMAVSVSLLTSQTLLLLSNIPTGIFCKAFGIVLHWAWLSTFVWMTMMAANLVKTFTAKSTALHSNRPFSFYVVIAVSVPALIVGACAAVDLADMPNMVIGYGGNGACWISNKKALLIVFGVPLAMLLLVNVVCFVITICSIERSMHISKTATSTRKDRVKCIIYSKLFIITGLTWAFGFAAAFSNSEELWYVFIVLNGSQGLYIFIFFAFSRRVVGLLKVKILQMKRHEDYTHESRTWSTQM